VSENLKLPAASRHGVQQDIVANMLCRDQLCVVVSSCCYLMVLLLLLLTWCRYDTCCCE
jgi:hypothetical protein